MDHLPGWVTGVVFFWLLAGPSAFFSFGQFPGGSGTPADPFHVSTLADLQAMKQAPNTAHFVLINDIDASASSAMNDGQGFDPVGWFNGGFNGQGFTIDGLYINRPGSSGQALFVSSGSSAVFENVHFENVSITGGHRAATLVGTLAGTIQNVSVTGNITGTSNVGGIAGQIDSSGNISDSHVDATVTGSGDYVGGLVGLLNSGASASSSTAAGSVSGASRVGGLAGQSNSGTSITGSHTTADVSGTGIRIGGLVGYNNQGELTHNSSSGNVSGDEEVGGLVGRNETANGSLFAHNHSDSQVTGDEKVGGLIGYLNGGIIEASFSTGEVTGTTDVGGLVGFAAYGNAVIRLSYSTSTVSSAPGGGNRNQFGGLVGSLQSGTIENSFARGDVCGNNRVGGLVGEMRWDATVINSYSTGTVNPEAGQDGGLIGREQQSTIHDSFWDTETSGLSYSAGGTGKTTAEMLTQATFAGAGWDFVNIWTMDPEINDGYPFLKVFLPDEESVFYSRQDGTWDDGDTWSLVGYGGPAAGSFPGPNDVAFIGDNDNVALTGDVLIETGTVTVDNTGRLTTSNHVISGAGSFSLLAGGTLQIGSDQGISAEMDQGSIQTADRSFSQEASYIYEGNTAQITGDGLPHTVNGLRIDNPAGVSHTGDLVVNGMLQLDNGLFTMSPGASLVANNTDQGNGSIRMQVTIAGNKGWRMVGSPVQTDFLDLLDGFVSQGFGGSDYPGLQPNILWFDEEQIGTTNMAWRAPGAITEQVGGGRGHFLYVFDGAGMPDNGGNYPDELPITMDGTGLEYATGGNVFDFGITYTQRSEGDVTDTDIPEMNTGWNLLANPSTASIDWDAAGGWIKENVDNAVYVWDPSANNGNGTFLVWNGQTGTLGNGVIAPFQGFWVHAGGENPTLAMTDQAKTTGGAFAGKDAAMNNSANATEPWEIVLTLTAAELTEKAFLTFSANALYGKDPFDAYRLEPMEANWLKVFTTTTEHDKPLVINNLPPDFEETLVVPVHVGGQWGVSPITGPYDFSWSIQGDWPSDWKLTLMDHAKEKAIPLGGNGSVEPFHIHTNKAIAAPPAGQGQFSLPDRIVMGSGSSAGTQPAAQRSPGTTKQNAGAKTASIDSAPRFSIVITKGETAEHPDYISPEPTLFPVFPNPVREGATIRFSLPREERVVIGMYDLHGRLVRRLADETKSAGSHKLHWTPGHSLANGIYILTMHAGQTRAYQKIMLVK